MRLSLGVFPAGQFYRFKSREEKHSRSSLQSKCKVATDANLSVRCGGRRPGSPGRAARKGSRVPAHMRNGLGARRPSAPSQTDAGLQSLRKVAGACACRTDGWRFNRSPSRASFAALPLLSSPAPNTLASSRGGEEGGLASSSVTPRGFQFVLSGSAPGALGGGGAAVLELGTPAPTLPLLEPSRQSSLVRSEP